MKKLFIAFFIIHFLYAVVTFAEEEIDTTLLLPDIQDVNTLYNKKFNIEKSDFYPIYKNHYDSEEKSITSSIFFMTKNYEILYISISYCKNPENVWKELKNRIVEATKRNKKQTSSLNLGDDSVFGPASWASYGVKYNNFVIFVVAQDSLDGKLIISSLLKKIDDFNSGLLEVKSKKNRFLYIKRAYLEKSSIFNKAGSYEQPIRIQIFTRGKELYNKFKKGRFELKKEQSIYQFSLLFPLDKKIVKVLKDINDGILILSIEKYNPLIIKNINASDFIDMGEYLTCTKTSGDVMSIFTPPEYCTKRGLKKSAVLHNLAHNSFYFYLGKNIFDNFFLFSEHFTGKPPNAFIIENNYGLNNLQFFLDEKGRLAARPSYKNTLYVVKNGKLVELPKVSVADNSKLGVKINESYIFNGELINHGSWLTPYITLSGNEAINYGAVYLYKRDYQCEKLMEFICNGKLKTKKLTFTFSNILEITPKWKGKYEVKGNILKKPKEAVSPPENYYLLNGQLVKLKESTPNATYCTTEKNELKCRFQDYFNGKKIRDVNTASDEYYSKCFRLGIPGSCENEVNIPIDFGIPIALSNDYILNQYEGPYSELIICDKGVKKQFNIKHTGWIVFDNKMEKDIRITVFKKGFEKKIEHFTISIENVKNATIEGIITDRSGNPVENAKVTIMDKTVYSDEKGHYKVILSISENGEDAVFNWDEVLTPILKTFHVNLLKQDKFFPDKNSYFIEFEVLDNKTPLKKIPINIAKYEAIYDKNGNKLSVKDFEKGVYINKRVKSDEHGIVKTTIKSFVLKDEDIKKFHKLLFPLKVRLKICEELNHKCDNISIEISDPSPVIKVIVPSGVMEGTWQERATKVTINDENSNKFKIEVKAPGRIKLKGVQKFYSNRMRFDTDKKELELFFEPTIRGTDLNRVLPNELDAYFKTNLNVLSGFIGIVGDLAAGGKIIPNKIITQSNILAKLASVKFESKKAKTLIEFSYALSSKGLSAYALGLGAKNLEVKNFDTDKYITLMDWSVGFVDLIGGAKSDSITHQKVFNGIAWAGEKLKKITKGSFGNFLTNNKVVKYLKIDKLSQVISPSSMSGVISLEIMKAIYANAKTTYDLYKQYNNIVYSYEDIIFVPFIIKVEDEDGYFDAVIKKVGVKIRRLNDE
ncbi:carboxypeptidase-like regulatory domain-containing protein [Deferribacter abyssi]|uniref:carboxypeptidase-like regulatory domain-containing protein n=1 Tax=Deferribacter abyssi TaxID=213806 RepID=UPI003C1EF515